MNRQLFFTESQNTRSKGYPLKVARDMFKSNKIIGGSRILKGRCSDWCCRLAAFHSQLIPPPHWGRQTMPWGVFLSLQIR